MLTIRELPQSQERVPAKVDPAVIRPRLKSQWEVLRDRPVTARAPRPSFFAKMMGRAA